MEKYKFILKGFTQAAGTLVYVAFVAQFLFNNQKFFGNNGPSFLIPLFVLMLLVISASITGLLVLGKPFHLYSGGFKKEAAVLLFVTLAWLTVFLFAVAFVLTLR